MVGDILQPTHLIFVLVVALLVLGPKRLPEVGRQLGSGLRDFRAAINGERSEPEEVQAPYEQPASDTAAEHQFAHSAGDTTTAEGHEFAHEPSGAIADQHQFAHEPSEAAANGHESVHQADTNVGDHPGLDETPAGGHEFAYETPESSGKRTDPPA
ncbi:MAG: twin-arginine translocase TatA/TatE family subunit [Solirubrobacteraceae bacterium]